MQATYELQHGRRGYSALLEHILHVSVTDLKKNYENLNVSFDLWKGESDAQPYIPAMVQKMKDDGFAHLSEGALVVDVALGRRFIIRQTLLPLWSGWKNGIRRRLFMLWTSVRNCILHRSSAAPAKRDWWIPIQS